MSSSDGFDDLLNIGSRKKKLEDIRRQEEIELARHKEQVKSFISDRSSRIKKLKTELEALETETKVVVQQASGLFEGIKEEKGFKKELDSLLASLEGKKPRRESEVNMTEDQVVSFLVNAGKSMTHSEIRDETGMSNTMTYSRLKRLTESGKIIKITDPESVNNTRGDPEYRAIL